MLSLRRTVSANLSPALVSGTLGGLSYVFLPGVPSELLMWGWMVPLLVSLRGETRFRRLYGHGVAATAVGLFVACWWIALPSVRVGFVGIGLGTLFVSVPWAVFWALQRLASRRVALWSFPLVWVVWEAAMLSTAIAPAGNMLANSQGRLTWLVQMADLGGAGLVTGWVVLVNVALVRAVERWQDAQPGSLEASGPATRSVHAGAAPRTGAGDAWRRANPVARRALGLALARTVGLALVLPLGYAAVRLATLPPDAGTVRVTSVQPNLIPAQLTTRAERDAASLAMLDLATGALDEPSARRPDLVVLPEVAFLGDLRRDPAERVDVVRFVARTGVPVLTGMVSRPWVPPAARSPTLRLAGRAHLQQNAAVLVTPALARRRWAPADTLVPAGADPSVYVKRRLIPFVEGLPYTDLVPALRHLGLALSPHGFYDARTGEAPPLAFDDRRGRPWKLGVMICYEQFYGHDAAKAVQQGAAVLVAPTNESWFARTSGSRLISVASRLRAVETRRTLVRATTTGITGFVDARGRPYGEIPTWTAATATADVALRTDLTVYAAAPAALPIASAVGLALIVVAAAGARVRRRRVAARPSSRQADAPFAGSS